MALGRARVGLEPYSDECAPVAAVKGSVKAAKPTLVTRSAHDRSSTRTD